MTVAEDVLSGLACGRSGCPCVASVRAGHGLTHCCVHDDRTPSLNVTPQPGDKVLLRCHAGCDQRAVFDEVKRRGLLGDAPATRELVAAYDYTDEGGALLYQVVRYAPKDFRQRRPDGAGGWISSLNGTRRTLYNLPAVLEAVVWDIPIYIVEGEKDADALNAAGLVATCNSGGAEKWRPEYAQHLKGAHVVIVQDKDEPGYRHAAQVFASLDGVAATVRVVEAKTGKDAFDHLAAGHTVDEFVPAKRVTAEPEKPGLKWLTAREIAEQTPEAVDWVVQGYVARGAITDWSAKVKTGKTSLMLVMARCIVNGERFLGLDTAHGPVVILTEERPPSFRSALGRWGLLQSDDVHVLYRREARGMEWPEIIEAAVEKCLSVGAVLLVVDTFADWAQFGADQENDAGAAGEAMLPVQTAAEHGIAVLISRHDRKSGGEIGESARGSSAVAGKADILVSIRRSDGTGHERRRVIVAVGRFDDTPEQLVVELNAQDQYIALGDTTDVERKEAIARILDIIPSTEPGFTLDEIADKSPNNARSTLNRALKDLEASHQITARKGAGKSGRAIGYFRPSSENIPPLRGVGMFDKSASDKEEASDGNVRSSETNIPPSDPLRNKGWNIAPEACQDCLNDPVYYDESETPLCAFHASDLLT